MPTGRGTYHEPSGFCTFSRYFTEFDIKSAISFFLCPGYNFLNKTKAWIAEDVHSTYSCSMTMSSKNSVGFRSCKWQMMRKKSRYSNLWTNRHVLVREDRQGIPKIYQVLTSSQAGAPAGSHAGNPPFYSGTSGIHGRCDDIVNIIKLNERINWQRDFGMHRANKA